MKKETKPLRWPSPLMCILKIVSKFFILILRDNFKLIRDVQIVLYFWVWNTAYICQENCVIVAKNDSFDFKKKIDYKCQRQTNAKQNLFYLIYDDNEETFS